ncbi:MAG TPA: CHAT domain-containing protein [Halomicronema sp.]
MKKIRVFWKYLSLIFLGFLLVMGGPVLGANSRQDFVEVGRVLYESGRFFDAVKVWEEGEEVYRKDGDILRQVLVLSYVGNGYLALGNFEKSSRALDEGLLLISTVEKSGQKNQVQARLLMSQGSLYLAKGQAESALNSWQVAEKLYTSLNDQVGVLGSLVNQAQALQVLGLYREAKIILKTVYEDFNRQPDSVLKASGLQGLGVTLQVMGDLEKSQQVLEESLGILVRLNALSEQAVIFLSLGNTFRGLKDYSRALNFYDQTVLMASDLLLKLEAKINKLSLLVEGNFWDEAKVLCDEITSEIGFLPASRSSVYAKVNFVQSLMKIPESEKKFLEIAKLLATAVQQAQSLQDRRAEASAILALSSLYQKNQQLEEAKSLSLQAIALAETINAEDILARTQGNLGKILKEQGEIKAATNAYKEAVKSWQSLRRDLVAINQDVQFSFQESIEPVYRELVSLLLDSSAEPDQQVSQENLKQARLVIEALQLAELDNFFREACLNIKPQQVDQIDPKAAVIYPIILEDRLMVIFSLPARPLQYYSTKVKKLEFEKVVEELYESFNILFPRKKRLEIAQKFYSFLVEPAEKELAASEIETLVFVPDGLLRNVPMAALYDGEKYLIEKYSVAITPGLQLLPPQKLEKSNLKVLMGGLTEARQGFGALPAVKLEAESISNEVSATVFLNEDFTEKVLQEKLLSSHFPLVHLATHGQFSSNPEETFILTWDEKIKVRNLEYLLQSGGGEENAIDLLVLSACQTAAGDRRAALGLAGVALRSGARSTVGTLWSVQDLSTAKLMTEFYQQLTLKGVSKASALRHAQLSLLKEEQFEHPFYWAAFILVGNWL